MESWAVTRKEKMKDLYDLQCWNASAKDVFVGVLSPPAGQRHQIIFCFQSSQLVCFNWWKIRKTSLKSFKLNYTNKSCLLFHWRTFVCTHHAQTLSYSIIMGRKAIVSKKKKNGCRWKSTHAIWWFYQKLCMKELENGLVNMRIYDSICKNGSSTTWRESALR